MNRLFQRPIRQRPVRPSDIYPAVNDDRRSCRRCRVLTSNRLRTCTPCLGAICACRHTLEDHLPGGSCRHGDCDCGEFREPV